MHLKYRPEIDGLRTLAVLSVLIYHAEFAFGSGMLLSGGFLGVDIFFVISGFLITSLIIKEQKQTGSFSISNFYERRARRLLPALFVVMLVTLPIAWVYLIPLQFIDFSKSQISSLLFASNFYWDQSLQEYGAESSLYKPFLHTWSLAVEEQFYIIFPLILIAIHRWLKNHALTLLSIGFVISLLFSEWMTGQDSSSSFYMLPSRFWELLAGSLLAYYFHKHPQKQQHVFLNQSMPMLGLLLIAYSIFFTQYNDNHPGFITLTVIIGTVLIIWFSSERNPVTLLLASKAFVSIGLISYSLYLWHYPVFAFGRMINTTPDVSDKLSWFAISFILSFISYRLIEKPFRNKTVFNRRRLALYLGLTATLIFVLNAVVIHKKGLQSRLPSIISSIEMQPSKISVCHKKAFCSFNSEFNDTVFLVGDSHLMALEKAILKYSAKKQFNFTTLTTNGCQYILNLNSVDKKNNKISACNTQLQENRREHLLAANNARIIIGGNLPSIMPTNPHEGRSKRHLQYPDNSLTNAGDRTSAIKKEYQASIIELADRGNNIIVIYPIPAAGWDIPSKISQLIFRKTDAEVKIILSKKMITTSYQDYLKDTKSSFDLLDGIQHKNIIRIYPHKLFCNTTVSDRCVTHDQNNSFYRDDQHLSATGRNMLFELIKKEMN